MRFLESINAKEREIDEMVGEEGKWEVEKPTSNKTNTMEAE